MVKYVFELKCHVCLKEKRHLERNHTENVWECLDCKKKYRTKRQENGADYIIYPLQNVIIKQTEVKKANSTKDISPSERADEK